MATENEGVCCSEKKGKCNYLNKQLLVGDKVEVRSVEKGYEGSWHQGTVIACEGQTRRIQYDDHLCIDGSNKLNRTIKVPPIFDGIISATNIHHSHRGCIRPLPPPLNVDMSTLHLGQCVDAYHNEAWWEGVIFDSKDDSKNRLIFFPDTGLEMHLTSNKLRITQDWDEFLGQWKPHKNWYFLELIEEFKEEWPLPVSVKQIWSEVKGKEGFRKQLKRWTSLRYGLWRHLVWEAFSDNLKLVLKHFFKEPNLLEEKADKPPLLVLEASYGDILKPKSHSSSHFQELVSSPKTPGGKPRSVYKKRKHMWLHAGSDIVPGPEFCPDSVREFIHVYNRKKRPSPQLRLNVRKHLLFLGWKIEFMRFKGVLTFQYTSPEGKPYVSLLKVCENLNGEYSEPGLESKVEELSCNGSKSSPRKSYQKRRHMWEPAGCHLIPKAEFCPDAIREFNLHSQTRRRPGNSLILNVRKHLSFLGWKIEFMRYNGAPKMRYTSPEGTSYESLPKAMHNLSEATDTFSVPYKNKANILPALSDKPHSSLPDEPRTRVGDLAVIPPVIEPEYCPEAIEQYYLLGAVEKVDYARTFEDPKNKEVKMKAKKHLAALGWSFWYTRGRDKCVPRYTSKSGKRYDSLRAACKGCIDEGVVYENNAIIPVAGERKNVDENEKEKENAEALAQFLLKSKSIELPVKSKHKKNITEVRKGRKKRMNSVMTLDSHLLHKRDKNAESKHLKKRKKTQSMINIKSMDGDCPKSAISSRKRSKKGVEIKLSWLMDNKVLFPGEKVHYVRREDNCRIGEGVITRDGIECNCCQEVFTLSNFELHVCNNNHKPEGTILLEDGRSLSDCELQLKCSDDETGLTMGALVMDDRWDPEKSDYICSICRYGGKLILCDQCPSAFHTKCLGLQCVPDGDWFCPSCCCGICGCCRFNSNTEEFEDERVLSCDQCEHKYHVGCLRQRGILKLETSHKENWFCRERCEEIFLGLQKLLGKRVPIGEENISWTLLKYTESNECDHDGPDKESLTENYSKLNAALFVMHECFEPSRERKTRRDVLEDVIFSRWSELNRLNFQGFYTVILEKLEEVITVATLRVYGEKVAEVPLIGTRVEHRRLGMCHILMNELEKKLMELGVERLVLPAVPSVLKTWTESFGFSKMTASERLNFVDYTFLDFEGTTMCQKLLRDIPSTCLDHLEPEQTTLMLYENRDSDENSVVSEVLQADPAFSTQEADPVLSIHKADPVFQMPEGNPTDKVEIADRRSAELFSSVRQTGQKACGTEGNETF